MFFFHLLGTEVSGLLLVTVLAFLIVLVFMSVWKQRKVSGKLPPGPTPLPFIGNYFQLNTEQIYNSLVKVPLGRAKGRIGDRRMSSFHRHFVVGY